MIIELDANLLELPILQGFIHSCNCFHTMGGGIAKRIKDIYPELYQADLQHGRRGDITRLGKFSTVKCHDGKQGYNLYGQYMFGMDKRYTNYEAIYTGLEGIAKHALQSNITILGLPRNMGCRLGGGNWNIVRSMINEIFDQESGIELYICNYDG